MWLCNKKWTKLHDTNGWIVREHFHRVLCKMGIRRLAEGLKYFSVFKSNSFATLGSYGSLKSGMLIKRFNLCTSAQK